LQGNHGKEKKIREGGKENMFERETVKGRRAKKGKQSKIRGKTVGI
jgi:hypothetical protein